MIDNCPKCGYSLDGLPDEHRCPECGQEYERSAVSFGEPRRAWILMVIFNSIMLLLSVVGWLWRGRAPMGLWLVALFATMTAGWIWSLRRTHHVILVSRRTIRILGREENQEVYRLSDVGTIKWHFVTGDILIERSDGTELTVIKRRFLASNLRARKIVKMVRAYAQLDGDT